MCILLTGFAAASFSEYYRSLHDTFEHVDMRFLTGVIQALAALVCIKAGLGGS
jgi:hypothetical protein